LYLEQTFEDDERDRLARALVERARIPMVAVVDRQGRVHVWVAGGKFVLPEDAAQVFTPGHPFLQEMTEDFIALCRHPEAGDFVLWGWSRYGPTCTFPIEHGSHGGPGLEETHAFALLPVDAPVQVNPEGWFRPLGLREAALRHLGRERNLPAAPVFEAATKDVVRVMTYNVHNCRGIDGRLSPRRISRVIARYQPDVVALQELDVGRARTGWVDQGRTIAEYLQMDHHFNPILQLEEGFYGECILSHLPMRLVRREVLPMLHQGFAREQRAALWVTIDLGGAIVHVVNTHLTAGERLKSKPFWRIGWQRGYKPRGPVRRPQRAAGLCSVPALRPAVPRRSVRGVGAATPSDLVWSLPDCASRLHLCQSRRRRDQRRGRRRLPGTHGLRPPSRVCRTQDPTLMLRVFRLRLLGSVFTRAASLSA
jgi:hypothetical protein